MRETNRGKQLLAGVVFAFLLSGLARASLAADSEAVSPAVLEREVSRQLATLPYYDVFDQITFHITTPSTAVLMGEVTRPGLRSDAEAVVQRIGGIRKVVNNIEVLPNSPMDDAIRWEAFKAIFEKPSLQKYAIQTVSPLRIIVKNGWITLDGTVASQFDKSLIDLSAKSITEALGVTDNLVVHS
jgi:hyperosmotically inducible protein